MNYRSLGNGINGAVECIDTLANILALTLGTSVTQTTVPVGSKARPTDVAGCTLEMGADGKWTGASVGSFATFGELDALPKGNLAIGVRASVAGVQYTYGARGWAEAGGGASRYGVAAVGDSITGTDGHGGWFDYACIMSNARIMRRGNFAISGAKINEMLSQVDKAAESGAEWCWIQGGTNRRESSTGVNDFVSTAISDMEALVEHAIEKGLRVRLFGIPPADSATVSDYRRYCESVNIAFQTLARRYNQQYSYLWGHIVDPATGGCLAGTMFPDLVHPTYSSHYLAAQKLLAEAGGSAAWLYLPGINQQGTGDIWSNPLHITEATAGELATNWTTSVAGTGFSKTLTTADSGFGKKQSLVAAAITVDKSLIRSIAGAVVGSKYIVVAQIAVTCSTDQIVRMGVQFLDASYASVRNDYAFYGVPAAGLSGLLYLEFDVPVGADVTKSRFIVTATSGTTATASIERHQMTLIQ